jgi:2,5-diamino-6-(ribosylamino)-4(3H)-pyrimidinone 5'-phosphate reductase
MLPRVILHNGVSVDGRMDWLNVDLGLYYGLTSTWPIDAILAGSETMLAAYPPDEAAALEAEESIGQPAPDAPLQRLVVVDSRGRVRSWRQIRRALYWRDPIALCSHATSASYLDYLRQNQIEYLATGDDRVDLRAALEELNIRYGISVMRVDSGGALNGALLRAGLVDEVSILVNPCLVGGTSPRSIFVAPDLTSAGGAVSLKLTHVQEVQTGVVWLRYEVIK